MSASQDNTIKVWDIKQIVQEYDYDDEGVQTVNQAMLTVMAHQKFINVAKFSPNDKFIASASQDKSIKIWSAKDLQLLQTLTGHRKNVWDIQFSPVEKQLVSVSGDLLVKVWDLSGNGKCMATL